MEHLGIAHARDDRVGDRGVQQASPPFGVPLMAIAIMISTFGCVNGLVLMGARLYYAMAQDGLFFQAVGRLNRRGVPAAGLILQAHLVDPARLFRHLQRAARLRHLRGTAVLRADGRRPVRAALHAARRRNGPTGRSAIRSSRRLYVILCVLIMVDLLMVKPLYTWPGLIIVLTGIPVYFLWRVLGRRAAS